MLNNNIFIFTPKNGNIKSDFIRESKSKIKISTDIKGFAIYGPFITLDAGEYIGEIFFSEYLKNCKFIVDIIADNEPQIANKLYDFYNDKPRNKVYIKWHLKQKVTNLEMRMFVFPGFSSEIEFTLVKKM